MKYDYLWIDSFCIIQDSTDDWQLEPPRMKDVYRHADFTVGAAHASDGRQGCLSVRDPSKVKPLVVNVERPRSWRDWLDTIFPPIFPQGPANGQYVCPDDFLMVHEIDESPLAARAWVVQERVSSRRMLYFGKTQLFFICPELRACESYPTIIPRSMYSMGVFFDGLVHLRDPRNAMEYGYLPNVWNAWRNVIQAYTDLALTYQQDRLAAFASIAQQISMHMKPEAKYAAGLWMNVSSTFSLVQLLWSTHKLKPRPKHSAAPTWSWASVESPISETYSLPDGTGETSNLRRLGHVIGSPVVELTGPDTFGGVKSGILTIEGFLLPVVFSPQEDHNGDKVDMLRLRTRQGQLERLYYHLDTTELNLDGKLFCCPLLACSVKSEYWWYGKEWTDFVVSGLVLRPVDNIVGRYERVGIFSCDDDGEEAAQRELLEIRNKYWSETVWDVLRGLEVQMEGLLSQFTIQ